MKKHGMKKRVLSLLLAGLLVIGNCAVGTTAKAEETANVAQYKIVYASNVSDFWKPRIRNLVDGVGGYHAGDFSTTEVKASQEEWAVIDLGGTYEISRVQLVGASKQALPRKYRIEVYDGSQWVKVADGGSTWEVPTDPTDETVDEKWHDFDAIVGSAVRIYATELAQVREGTYSLRLSEMKVFGTKSEKQVDSPFVVRGQVYASNATDFWESLLPNLVDGQGGYYVQEFSTTPVDASQEEWAAIDLGGAYAISRVQLVGAYKQALPGQYRIEVYDGFQWVTVAKEGSTWEVPTDPTDETVDEKWHDFDAIVGSAVRIYATELAQRSDNGQYNSTYSLRLSEMAVYGIKSAQQVDSPFEKLENIALESKGTVAYNDPVIADDAWYVREGYTVAQVNNGVNSTYHNVDKYFSTPNVGSADEERSIILAFDGTKKIREISFWACYWDDGWSGEGYKGFPQDFTIDVYTNGEWKTVIGKTGYTAETEEIKFSFDCAQLCTAVRLHATKLNKVNADNYALQLAEIQVFGKDAATEMESYKAVYQEGTNVFTADTAKVYLDKTYKINEIVLRPRKSSDGYLFPERFALSVYNGTEWTEVADETAITTVADEMKIRISPIIGSAVCFTAEGWSSGQGVVLSALQVYGVDSTTSVAAPEDPKQDSVIVSSGMEYASSKCIDWADKDGGVDRLTDNDKNTWFATWFQYTENSHRWVSCTFDSAFTVTDIYMNSWNNWGKVDYRFPKDFTIEVYTGGDWKTVVAATDYDYNTRSVCFEIEPTVCTAVRLSATKLDHGDSDSNYSLALGDMIIYGDNATASMAAPEATPTTESTTTTLTKVFASSTESGYDVATLNDMYVEQVKPYWRSETFDSAEDSVSLQFYYLKKARYIDSIRLYPRLKDGMPVGFSDAFSVYAFVDGNWKKVYSISGLQMNNLSDGGFYEFSFAGVYTNSIKIVTSGLTADANGKYCLQLCDVWLMTSAPTYVKSMVGDLEQDSVIDDKDAAGLRSVLIGKREKQDAADINYDSVYNLQDLVRITKLAEK